MIPSLTCILLVLAAGFDAPAPESAELFSPYLELSAATPLAPRSRQAARPRAAERSWWGVEAQLYPAGGIPGLHAQFPVSDHGVITARLAYNITERGDFGEHDDERGGGLGGGVGYRHYFGDDLDGWMVGGRLDVWALRIDWREDAPPRSGSSDVLVVQPTVEGGYGFRLGDGLRLDLGLALGVEINAHTSGESVGQGAILLGGATLTWGF